MAFAVLLGCGGDDLGAAGEAGTTAGGAGQGGTAGDDPEEFGTFKGFTGFDHKLAMGGLIACSIGTRGAITCQGSYVDDWDPPPSGSFERIALGAGNACALDADGRATCWGAPLHDFVLVAPEGPFTAIAVQGDAACGIRPSGSIDCWGEHDDGLLAAPEGRFSDLVMHDDEACALARDGHIECWGNTAHAHGRVDGVFAQLALQFGNLCTLDMAGKIACHDSFAEEHAAGYGAGTYTTFSVANGPVCGIKADGEIECFDDDSIGRLPPPAGPWIEIDGFYLAEQCARAMDGRVECWGLSYGDGGAELECRAGYTELSGTIGGRDTMSEGFATQQSSSSKLTSGYRFAYVTGSSHEDSGIGFMVFDGDANLGQDSAPERALEGQGDVEITRSVLMLGSTLNEPGELYCTAAGSGSTMSLNIDEVLLDLQNLSSLGACAGTPVDGELTFCSGDGGCADTMSGTLEGMAIAGSTSDGWLTSDGGVSAWYGDTRDFLLAYTDEAGNVAWAVYVSAPESPYAGAVYCAGEGSTVELEEETVSYTLRNLSKAPACPEQDTNDALSGCAR